MDEMVAPKFKKGDRVRFVGETRVSYEVGEVASRLTYFRMLAIRRERSRCQWTSKTRWCLFRSRLLL
jgi:hypothetical protein